MEYERRQPIKDATAQEATAFTMKSIQELLDEAGSKIEMAQVSAPPAPKASTPPALQLPQHLRNPHAMPVVERQMQPYSVTPRPAAKPALSMPLPHSGASNVTQFPTLDKAVEEKPRSFLKRLMGA